MSAAASVSGPSTTTSIRDAQDAAKRKLKPLDKSGHWANMSDAQKDTVAKFEARLEKEGVLPDEKLGDEEQRVTIVGRFLRARDWDIERATKMYLDMRRWRAEVDLDTLMKPKEEGGYDFAERQAVADRGWKMYFHSTDKYNRPIFVQDLGHLQIDSVFEHTTSDRIVRFFAINLEDAVRNKYRICTEDKRQAAREAGVAEDEVKRIAIDDNFMILNIEGLGMGTFWSFKNKLQQLLGILDANFPELSGRVQIINAPWLFSTVWSYIKPWLPVNTVAKIDIAGYDYKETLHQFIDPADLPVEIGGTCRCDVPGGCAFSNRGPWQGRQWQQEASQATAGDHKTSNGETVGSEIPVQQERRA